MALYNILRLSREATKQAANLPYSDDNTKALLVTLEKIEIETLRTFDELTKQASVEQKDKPYVEVSGL